MIIFDQKYPINCMLYTFIKDEVLKVCIKKTADVTWCQFQNQLTELKFLVLYLFDSHNILLRFVIIIISANRCKHFFLFRIVATADHSMLFDLFRVLSVTRKTVNERYIFSTHVNNPRPKFWILGHSFGPDGFFCCRLNNTDVLLKFALR